MQKVFDYMEKYRMIEAKDKVIVGVSGGADSLCLLFVLQEYARRVPFSIEAVHVEHGIRGKESLEDAAFVERLAEREGIPFHLVSRPVPQLAKRDGLSLEEAGRRARYEAFEEIRKKTGAQKIAVAHNRNDQAETMLFCMARGSGLFGAGGMSPVRGHIIRPLLDVSRQEIEDYLVRRGEAWRTDSTNADTRYARNSLRHSVLPLLRREVNGAADAHLAALGEELREVQDYLRGELERKLDGMASCAPGSARIRIGRFLQEPAVMQAYCLRECLSRAGCTLKNVQRGHLEAVRGLAYMQSGSGVALPDGWTARREFDSLVLFQKNPKERREAEGFCLQAAVPGVCEVPAGVLEFRVFPYKNENIFQKIYTKWLDYDKISRNLSVRTRLPGDYLIINSQGGRKKLKDYLIEEKVPADLRGRVPLLAAGSEILWVVGHRISEAYKITPQTKHVLEVQWRETDNGRESNGTYFGGENRPEDPGDGAEDQ